MRLQGLCFPSEFLGTFSDRLLKDLAGNAFSTTVCTAVMICVLSLDAIVASRSNQCFSKLQNQRRYAMGYPPDIEASDSD